MGAGPKALRLVAGWLGVLLGSVGVIASIAGLLALLFLQRQFDRPFAGTVDKFVAAADSATAAATNVAGQLVVVRGFVAELDERVAARIRERLALDDADLARIDAAREQVRSVVDRARAWSEVAGTSLELIEHVAGLSGGERWDLAGFAARCGEEIDETKRLLDEFSDKLAEVRAAPPERVSILEEIAGRLDGSLAKLQGVVEESVAAVNALKVKVTGLQSRIAKFLRVSSIVLFFLLLFQVAAQVCLLKVGWQLRGGPGRGGV
jgi:hypothetical protein